jgi:hypothetical protein
VGSAVWVDVAHSPTAAMTCSSVTLGSLAAIPLVSRAAGDGRDVQHTTGEGAFARAARLLALVGRRTPAGIDPGPVEGDRAM